MSRCTCDAIRATGWCPAHPPKPHVDLRDAELASLRAEVERLKGDHAQVAGALGCVHEQSMGECHTGTGDDVLCAIATLRGEIVILHSANARGASMVNEINAARAAFARRLGDALGISEDDSIIAAIATLRADLARVTEERGEAMAALEGVGDALGGLELYALSETAGHVETVVADRDEALADLARVEAERDEARADDAKLGAAVRAVLDMFMWDHSTVRAEVESDRLAETVEGCIFVAIERAIRPADFVPAHAKASGGDS